MGVTKRAIIKVEFSFLHSIDPFLRRSWLPHNFPRAQKTFLYFGEQTWECFIKIPSQTENSSVQMPQKKTHAFLSWQGGTCGATIKKSEKHWLRLIFQLINANQTPQEGKCLGTLLKVRALLSAKSSEVGVPMESQVPQEDLILVKEWGCRRRSWRSLEGKSYLMRKWRKLRWSQPEVSDLPACVSFSSSLPLLSLLTLTLCLHLSSFCRPSPPWQQQKVTGREVESVQQGLLPAAPDLCGCHLN